MTKKTKIKQTHKQFDTTPKETILDPKTLQMKSAVMWIKKIDWAIGFLGLIVIAMVVLFFYALFFVKPIDTSKQQKHTQPLQVSQPITINPTQKASDKPMVIDIGKQAATTAPAPVPAASK